MLEVEIVELFGKFQPLCENIAVLILGFFLSVLTISKFS